MYDIEYPEFLYNTYIHIMRQKVDAQILFPNLKIPNSENESPITLFLLKGKVSEQEKVEGIISCGSLSVFFDVCSCLH